jgi:hypothetical protein
MKIASIIKLIVLVGIAAGAIQSNAGQATNLASMKGMIAGSATTNQEASNETLSERNARMAWWRKPSSACSFIGAFIPCPPVIIMISR